MEKKSKGLKVVQIIFTIVGMIGFICLAVLFGSSMADVFDEDSAAAILAVIILFPLVMIFSLIPVSSGIVIFATSIALRKREEVKTKYSLTMLIIGIFLTVLPFILDALLLIIPNIANS